MPRSRAKDEEEVDSDSDFDAGDDDGDDGDDADHEIEEPQEKETKKRSVKLEAAIQEEDKDSKSSPQALPNARQKKRKRKVWDETVVDPRQSYERKTDNGGYAHTSRSRSRISKANTGNTPWNKGKNRSSADKAKIAAGVRARNRTVLLEKLKRLGLTEEEWFTKKREIKYLRERIRRSKLTNANHKAALAEQKLKAAIKATTEEKTPGQGKKLAVDLDNLAEEEVKEPEVEEIKVGEHTGEPNPVEVFSRDVAWTPHSFGPENQEYSQVCPDGGPGGLICCETCAQAYSSYLNQTIRDIEVQKTHKVGKEVQEILGFLEEGRKTLDRAVVVAKKKVPPLPPMRPEPEAATAKRSVRGKAANATIEADSTDWNVTSAVDFGATEIVGV